MHHVHRVWIEDTNTQHKQHHYPIKKIDYFLDFELSSAQKTISRQLVENYQHHRPFPRFGRMWIWKNKKLSLN